MPDHQPLNSMRRNSSLRLLAAFAIPVGLSCLIGFSMLGGHSAAHAGSGQTPLHAIWAGQLSPARGEELPPLPSAPDFQPSLEANLEPVPGDHLPQPESSGLSERSSSDLSHAAPAEACDDVWLIDTRNPTPHNPQPQFNRLQCGQWNPGDEAAFVSANQDGLPLCVWIHGYQFSAAAAEKIGLEVYHELRRNSPPGKRFRFVIWSWPSLKNGPCRIDARRKARRSDIEGFKLARVLEKLPTDVTVGLLGFSYGSRLAGSTLHFLAGGTLAGLPPVACQSPTSSASCRLMRAVLLAGALDCDAFTPQGLFNSALDAANCVLVLRNQYDPMLFAYRHLEVIGGTPAMGKVGPSPASASQSLVVWNVSSDIRVSHDWRPYVGNPQIFGPITSLLLYADRCPTTAPACQTATTQPAAPQASAQQPQAIAR